MITRFDDFSSGQSLIEIAVFVLFLFFISLASGCSPFSTGTSTGDRTSLRQEHPRHKPRQHNAWDHRKRNHYRRMSRAGSESLSESEARSKEGGATDSSSVTSSNLGDDTVARKAVEKGKARYDQKCSKFHGKDRRGDFAYPSLLEIQEQYSREELHDLRHGKPLLIMTDRAFKTYGTTTHVSNSDFEEVKSTVEKGEGTV